MIANRTEWSLLKAGSTRPKQQLGQLFGKGTKRTKTGVWHPGPALERCAPQPLSDASCLLEVGITISLTPEHIYIYIRSIEHSEAEQSRAERGIRKSWSCEFRRRVGRFAASPRASEGGEEGRKEGALQSSVCQFEHIFSFHF